MREKVIGILGGMGPEATLLLFQRILENTFASHDQEHARILIDSNPKIPERLPAIRGVGESPVPMMVKSGKVLENAGADFIIIPCISAHYFLPELRRQLRLPILSMIEETATVIEKQESRFRKIGLLAAQGALQGRLFQDRLSMSGIGALISEDQDLQKITTAIFRIKDTKGGHNREALKAEIVEIASRLIESGAEGVIVGCTELSLVIDSGALPVPTFDSLTILARAAIREAGMPLIPTI